MNDWTRAESESYQVFYAAVAEACKATHTVPNPFMCITLAAFTAQHIHLSHTQPGMRHPSMATLPLSQSFIKISSFYIC